MRSFSYEDAERTTSNSWSCRCCMALALVEKVLRNLETDAGSRASLRLAINVTPGERDGRHA